MTSSSLDRRTLFRRSAAVAAGAAAASLPFEALAARTAHAAPGKPTGLDYGPLAPARDQTTGLSLLALPRGFEYMSHGWTGDPLDNGTPTPGAHDGMAAFRVGDGSVHLVRNHERGNGAVFGDPAYDPTAGGGTTTVRFDPDAGAFLSASPSLAGTIRNCAGGPTPWSTWLSCEETRQISPNGMRHGYVFEVPSTGVSDAAPIPAMGRFSHEAVAVDPATGIVYQTEDAGATSGFYRYLPAVPGRLAAGGRLQMLKIGSTPYVTNADGTGTVYRDLSWVDIATPDPTTNTAPTPYQQGVAQGAATFARLEGAWYAGEPQGVGTPGRRRPGRGALSAGGVVYFISTSGGPVGQGQVFAYDLAADEIRVLFASPSAEVLNAPDNICVSPRGGIVLCEDGSGAEYLHGLTTRGEIFRFAENTVDLSQGTAGKAVEARDYRGSEWAGSVFEPKNGNWMFVNLQSPGITFAITGPWRRGAL